jgi:hypothetical protein
MVRVHSYGIPELVLPHNRVEFTNRYTSRRRVERSASPVMAWVWRSFSA